MGEFARNHNIEEVKTIIFGLSVECPMGNNPPDCPLREIRLLSLTDRFSWVNELSEEERQQYYEYHKKMSGPKRTALNDW